MVSARRDAEAITSAAGGTPPLHLIFEDLLSAFLRSPEGLKPKLLRSLYALLGNFSLRICIGGSYRGNVSYQNNIHELSNILFNNLERRFREFSLAISDVSSRSTQGKTLLSSDRWPNLDELTLLLRCCLTILTWLGFDQTLVLEKAKDLLSILSRLISFDVSGKDEENSITFKMLHREYTYEEDGCTTSVVEDFVASVCFLEASYTYRSSLCVLLEVFADELLAEESLRECFIHVESALSLREPLFICSVNNHKIEMILEVVSAHLVLLFSDEQAIETALDRLNSWHCKESRVPELSLKATLTLVLSPIVLSAPQLFQAHLILLVSEAIDIEMSPQNVGPNLEMECCLAAFEKSINLYKKHMSTYANGHPLGAKDSLSYSSTLEKGQPSFSSCIKQVTREKLDHIMVKSETLWESFMQNMTSENKTDLLSISVAYIRENMHFLDKSCKDEILSVLISLSWAAVSYASSYGTRYRREDRSPHDIYLLSSILKLMSISMLGCIGCLRHSGNMAQLNTSKELPSCRDYDHMLSLIRYFQQFDVHLPVQQFIEGMMKDHSIRNKDSTWMLLHFTGLLSLCFLSQLHFLIKGCLSVMMALMNLITFEGDLASLSSLLWTESRSLTCGVYVSDGKGRGGQKSSQNVASTFLKFQRQFLSQDSTWESAGGTQKEQTEAKDDNSAANSVESVDIEEIREETSKGEIFLKRVLKGTEKQSDYSDLADFIELKEGKDYFLWWKNRMRYRRKRLGKMAVLRWKRRKMSWKLIKRRRPGTCASDKFVQGSSMK